MLLQILLIIGIALCEKMSSASLATWLDKYAQVVYVI